MLTKRKLKIIDLFAWVGGLSYGFAHDDMFEIIAANEILPNMARAYELNHPQVKVYCKDIAEFGISDLKRDLSIWADDIDLVVGWPPCQAYSTVGKRLIDDPKWQLFQQYYRILQELRPRVFVFENVKWLLSMQWGDLIKSIITLFESLGYRVQYQVLNAADYGAPQVRERVIIIGSRFDRDFVYPEPTHYNPRDMESVKKNTKLLPYLTLSDAIGDLPLIANNEIEIEYTMSPANEFQWLMRKNAPSKILDHTAPKNNEKLIEIMRQLPDGGTPLDLPEAMRPTSGFANTYARLWWDRPSTTITRNLSTPSSSRCIHPRAPRPLTTREWARIQCFPDDYLFYGSRSDRNLQIGNAVPTFLSRAIKDAIKAHFMEWNHWENLE